MTVDFNIKSVAIIGGGPGGLAALNEFLHTTKEGVSTFKENKQAAERAFPEIVLFEQNSKPGGVWSSFDKNYNEFDFPTQNILDTEKYNKPGIVAPDFKEDIPIGLKLENNISNSLVEKITKEEKARYVSWISKSGVYDDLFTNIPAKFTRFSYLPDEEKYHDKKRIIYPFLNRKELSKRIEDLIEREDLAKYIRTFTTVVNLEKRDGKWELTLRKLDIQKSQVEWYKETFDAVVIANGHYSIPNIPHIRGLAEYNEKNPGELLHVKSYSNDKIFEGKKVLFVGGSISSLNILQYAVPRAKQVYISKRSPHVVFPWIDKASESEGIIPKPTIQEFLPDEKAVVFSDGSKESGFDLIVLATGYHYHFPFLENDKYLTVSNPSNLSRVSGLYLDDFSIEDPTLAAIGITITHLNFHSIEASAAAIAGVWSNAKKLPSKHEQLLWVDERLKKTGDNLFFHMYEPRGLKPNIVDKLIEYAPRDRENPLEQDIKSIEELEESFDILESLFYKLKEGKLTVKETTSIY
ncbi:uncharacterized protein PRCAT00003537001 [Priceomyces carsonii]|uniref:uncharacterized protein n=1 Tax=Priceomyces carsonii TaxID=28549 RepID=UPI002EDB8CDD|nr:unnamed protein product [Priceomyces carsonii]